MTIKAYYLWETNSPLSPGHLRNCCCRWLTEWSNLEGNLSEMRCENVRGTWEAHQSNISFIIVVARQHNSEEHSHESRLSTSLVSDPHCLGPHQVVCCLIIFTAIMNGFHCLSRVNSQWIDLHFFLLSPNMPSNSKKLLAVVVDALLMSHQPNLMAFRFYGCQRHSLIRFQLMRA